MPQVEEGQPGQFNASLEASTKELDALLEELELGSLEELGEALGEELSEALTKKQGLLAKAKSEVAQSRLQESIGKIERSQVLLEGIKQAQKFEDHPRPTKEGEPLGKEEQSVALMAVSDAMAGIKSVLSKHEGMPYCAERTGILLNFYLLLQQQGVTELSADYYQVAEPAAQQQQAEEKEAASFSLLSLIEKEQDRFVEQLENEGVVAGVRTDFLEGGRNNASVVAAIKARSYAQAGKSLSAILRKMRPFDVRESVSLLSKADEAAESIKNQDIILFLGDTGAGKSTTIHFLAGSAFQEMEERGMLHLKPVKIKNPALQQVATSAVAKSVTRYVRAVPMQYKDAGLSKKGTIVLCDTPGFGDTAGPEVDVANSLGIIKAVKGAKTVKIINLISYKNMGDRLQGIKRLVRTLSAFVSNIEEYKGTFSFFFTKFPKKQEKSLHASIQSVFDELSDEEREDKTFVGILEEMLEQTQGGAFFVRPLQDTPTSLLKAISISDKIDRPGDVFRFSISRESRASIDEQVTDARLAITRALKRHDYSLVHYRLDELRLLHTMLSDDASLKGRYHDALKEIEQSITGFFSESVTSFNRCLMEENGLTEGDVLSYQRALSVMSDMTVLRASHLSDDVVSVNTLEQNLHTHLTQFKKRVLGHISFDAHLQRSLAKFLLLAKHFPQANTMYAEIIAHLNQQVDDWVKKMHQAMMEHRFDDAANHVSDLERLSRDFSTHLDSKMILEKVQQFKVDTLEHLARNVSQFSQEFSALMDDGVLFSETSGIAQLSDMLKRRATLQLMLTGLQSKSSDQSAQALEENNPRFSKEGAMSSAGAFAEEKEGLPSSPQKQGLLTGQPFVVDGSEEDQHNARLSAIQQEIASIDLFLHTQQKPVDNKFLDLQKKLGLLENVLRHPKLAHHFGREQMDALYQQLMGVLQNKVEALGEEISNCYAADKEGAFKPIGILLGRIEFMRALSPHVVMKTDIFYNTLVSKLYSYVQESKRRVDHMLSKLLDSDVSMAHPVAEEYQELTACLINLRDAKWIDTVNGGIYKGTYDEIHSVNLNQIKQHVDELLILLKQIPLSFKHPERIAEAYKLWKAINFSTKVLSDAVPEFVEKRKEAENFFNRSISSLMDEVDQLFDLNKDSAQFLDEKEKERQHLLVLKEQFTGMHQAIYYLADQKYAHAQDLQSAMDEQKRQHQETEDSLTESKRRLQSALLEYQKHQAELQNIEQSKMNPKTKKEAIAGYIRDHKLEDRSKPNSIGLAYVAQEIAAHEKQISDIQEQGQQALVKIKEAIDSLEAVQSKYQTLLKEDNNDPRAANLLREAGFESMDGLNAKLDQVELSLKRGLNKASINKELQYDVIVAATAFFAELKRIPALLRHGEEGDEKIARCMRDYAAFINEQMQACFSCIESVHTESLEGMDAFIHLLFKRFKELKDLQHNHPDLFLFFPKDIFSSYARRLSLHHDELSERIPSLFISGNLLEHSAQLILAKKLSLLDPFFEGADRSYRTLYVEKRKDMDKELQNMPSLNEYMSQHDYQALGSALDLLHRKADQGDVGSQQTLKTAKRSLARNLMDYISDVVNTATLFAYEMSVDNIQPLLAGLNHIKQGKQFLIDYLDDEQVKLRLDKAPDEITGIVSEGLTQFLLALDAAIESNDFEEVENRKTAVKKMGTVLKRMEQSQILEKMQNIDERVKKRLNAIVSRYVHNPAKLPREAAFENKGKTMPIPPAIAEAQAYEGEPGEESKAGVSDFAVTLPALPALAEAQAYEGELGEESKAEVNNPVVSHDLSVYRFHPPCELLDNLKKVQGKHSMYKDYYDKLRKNIDARLREEIAILDRYQPEIRKKKMRELKAVIRTLSEDLKVTLTAELDNTSQDIEDTIKEINDELGGVIERGILEEIAEKFEFISANPNAIIFQRYLQDYLLKAAQTQAAILTQEMSAGRVSITLCQALKQLSELDGRLGSKIPQLRQYYVHADKQLKDFFKEVSDKLLSNIHQENVPEIKHYLSVFSDFVKLAVYSPQPSVLKNSLPEFENSVQAMHNTLCQSLLAKKELFVASRLAVSRKGFDILSFSATLHFFQAWEGVLGDIKQYVQANQKQFAELKPLVGIVLDEDFSSQAFNKYVLNALRLQAQEMLSETVDNDRTRFGEKERNAFFKDYFEGFVALEALSQSATVLHRLPEVKKISDAAYKGLSDKISALIHEAMVLTQYDSLKRFDDKQFNRLHQNLLSIQLLCPVQHLALKTYAKDIEKRFDEKFIAAVRLVEKNIGDAKAFADALIQLKFLGQKVTLLQERVHQAMDGVLRDFKNQHVKKGAQAITDLGVLLSQDVEGVGPLILEEHKIFKGYTLALFNANTARQDIHYVMSKMGGDAIDHAALKREFERFERQYRDIVDRNLRSKEMDLDELVRNINLLSAPLRDKARKKEIKSVSGYFFSAVKGLLGAGEEEEKADHPAHPEISWAKSTQDKMYDLMAHIFALWTLKNSEYYFEMKEGGGAQSDSTRQYLMQPHPAQVVAIFRMLGIGYDNKVGLPNNLQEVLTGEGKSLVLAVTSSILALIGFDIYVASYSQYLSRRDQEAARSLFDDLGVTGVIHYGTFNELCESVINAGVRVRDEVTGLLSGAGLTPRQPSILKPKILLIDEVDVFFNKDFYGNTYTPSATLQDPTVNALIRYIWTHRDAGLSLKSVQKTKEYEACSARFGNFSDLIAEAVKDMLAAVSDSSLHDYVCKEDKIGYKEQDGISFNISFGYKTLFAYFHEHDHGNISLASLDAHCKILIGCGEFSYADVTRQFVRIMGVTGTLKTLNVAQQRVIVNNYAIRFKSYIPSVYGDNQRVFFPDQHTLIEAADCHFATIVREIQTSLTGKDGAANKRAVLIFFENKEKLLAFLDTREFTPLKGNALTMTEEHTDKEKKEIIRKATLAGQVTLLTSSFGRGTDFVTLDKTVSNNGGIHVIQTFLSESKSEETQIQGRTARQGAQGSYGLVLNRKELEKYFAAAVFENEMKEMERTGKKYAVLDQRRGDFFEAQYKDCELAVINIAGVHEKSEAFLHALIHGNVAKVKAYLLERNRGAASKTKSRTICLMDATGSMASLLTKAKLTVSDMFDRASQVLEASGLDPQSFEMQFAVYRNYTNNADSILQASTWESKSANLRTFMGTIGPDGGVGNEAIEIGLWHVNREMENGGLVTQVILIGDAPPNTPAEVQRNRQTFCGGEAYWSSTKFGPPTTHEEQLQPIADAAVPVHAFYVAQSARRAFKAIANSTGGQCHSLDVNSAKGAKDLTDCITKQVLENVGGQERGAELVARYKKMFA